MEDTSKQEILESIAAFAEQVDQRFGCIDQKLVVIDQRFDDINKRFDGIDQRFDGIDHRFDSFEGEVMGAIHGLAQHMDERFDTMDSHFDEKLANLQTDLALLTKKSHTKLSVLVDRLVAEGSLKRATGDFILALEPFAQ